MVSSSPKPLLYFRTVEQMVAYREVPVAQKLDRLAAQMEFYFHTRLNRAPDPRSKVHGRSAGGEV